MDVQDRARFDPGERGRVDAVRFCERGGIRRLETGEARGRGLASDAAPRMAIPGIAGIAAAAAGAAEVALRASLRASCAEAPIQIAIDKRTPTAIPRNSATTALAPTASEIPPSPPSTR